jgi:hypothetical protein
MPLSDQEKLICEAVSNWLADATITADDKKKGDEESHTFTFQHEDVEQQYRLSIIDLAHYDGIASAFAKVHSHKYLDDPAFGLAFKKEMSAQAIPEDSQITAIKAVSEVLKKTIGEGNKEKDAGWNPKLDEIIKVSKPGLEEAKDADALKAIMEDIPQDTFDQERNFYKDEKVRTWLNGKSDHNFWEMVNRRIKPMLEQMGYDCGEPSQFWNAYDDPDTDVVIRNRMHELYEGTHSEYLTS